MFNSLQKKVVTKLKVLNFVRRLTVSSPVMPSKKRKSGEDNGSVSEPAAAKKPKEEKKNKSSTEWEEVEWTSEAKTGDDKPWNLKLASWNVDGLRAWHGKGGAEFLQHEAPDVLCLQETKVKEEKLPEDMKSVPGYPHCYWLAAQKDGYSGVGLMSKTKPLSVKYGFSSGGKEHNDEGRLITAEFSSYFLVTTYVPNAGRGLVTLDKRLEWDPLFREHVQTLDKEKPVIICGDMNVAHQEVDLKNPKTNKKNAGFTQEERDGFTELLNAGFVDSYRHFYPKKEGAYTFWTYMMNARAKNTGWRLDYFLVSSRLTSKLADCVIRSEVYGSDHCPLTLLLEKP